MKLFNKQKTAVIKESPIHELIQKRELEKQIKTELQEQNTHIQSIEIYGDEILIHFQEFNKFPQSDTRYEVTPEDILNICTYLGSFNYTIQSNYGVTIKYNIQDIKTVDEIEIFKILKNE